MIIDKSKFATKEALIDHIVANKEAIISAKKAVTKEADAISFYAPAYDTKTETDKAQPLSTEELLKKDVIRVKVVINTTNIMDSHDDVHMKGTFKRSVKNNKEFLFLREHKVAFESIITDNAKATLKEYDWSDLGYGYSGKTEALVFDAEIEKGRNPFMFDQYAKGYVKNHSVGMRYVALEFCANDDRYPSEKANWDKYIIEVVNKQDAEDNGYFWAVTEAKVIEGSAVPIGSNRATPTMSVKENNDDSEKSTHEQNNETPDGDITVSKEDFRNLLKQTLKN